MEKSEQFLLSPGLLGTASVVVVAGVVVVVVVVACVVVVGGAVVDVDVARLWSKREW